jgi:ferredoxin
MAEKEVQMRVQLDQEKCVGAGQCVMNAPSVFDQRDSDGIAVLLNNEPASDLDADVRTAAALCPALAIQLSD